MNRLSACLITLNEEHNLPRALASLQGIADEIVVVDSGSTDRTEEIARSCGAAFRVRPWTNYSEQKNYAASRAQNEWILSLDADEELSSELQTSLLDWKKRAPRFCVYEMARRTWYLGDEAQFSGIIHEALRFDGKIGRLFGDLLHYTVRTFAEHEAKVAHYTTLAAQQMYAEGKRNWRAAMWLATPWSWFQNFFLRGGFLDGYRGALIAQMSARAVHMKYRKLGHLANAAAKQERG